MSEPTRQGILGHLMELRQRIIWCALALVATTTVSFFFADQIIEVLKAPAGNVQFVYIEVTEAFSTYMKVCFTVGIIGAMPIIMYQLLMFVMPALTFREKRAVIIIMPAIIICFFGGVYFGYRFLIPPATHFLLSFGSNTAMVQPRLSNYVNFVINLILIIGLIFEMPVVVAFLARLGIVSSRWLWQQQKWVVVISFILAAVITPTPDAVNQTIVACVLIALYTVSIFVAWMLEKQRKKIPELEISVP
jgi:sec-independent protein translocase protein TatC